MSSYRARIAVVALLLPLSAATAQTEGIAEASRAGFAASLLGNDKRVTEHSVTIRGARVDYTATVGAVALHDSADRPSAIIAYTAYTRRGVADLTQRPITFAWNGGPSGASYGVHFGVLGPRRRTVDSNGRATTPASLTDNPESPLDRTDLVMVDPVGSGFSVPFGAYKLKDFYSIKSDAASIAQMIKRYLEESGRLQSPVYILGESYGTIRNPVVVNYLQAAGVPVAGIIFIASALDGNTIWEASGHMEPFFFYLPTYAAIAAYHKRLPAQRGGSLQALLREVEQFALNEFLTTLYAWPNVTASQRASILAKLHRFTGLSKEYWEKNNLRVGTADFVRELLRDSGRVIQFSDGRQSSAVPQPGARPAAGGVGNLAYIDAYLRDELGVVAAPAYRGSAPGSSNWNWFDHGLRSRSPIIPSYQNFLDDVAIAMKANPRLRVQQHSGIYDLQCAAFPANWALARMNIPPELRGNVQMFDYESGHAVFNNAPSEFLKFTANLVAFYDAADRTSVQAGRAVKP